MGRKKKLKLKTEHVNVDSPPALTTFISAFKQGCEGVGPPIHRWLIQNYPAICGQPYSMVFRIGNTDYSLSALPGIDWSPLREEFLPFVAKLIPKAGEPAYLKKLQVDMMRFLEKVG